VKVRHGITRAALRGFLPAIQIDGASKTSPLEPSWTPMDSSLAPKKFEFVKRFQAGKRAKRCVITKNGETVRDHGLDRRYVEFTIPSRSLGKLNCISHGVSIGAKGHELLLKSVEHVLFTT
jgi:hypothetical protein